MREIFLAIRRALKIRYVEAVIQFCPDHKRDAVRGLMVHEANAWVGIFLQGIIPREAGLVFIIEIIDHARLIFDFRHF